VLLARVVRADPKRKDRVTELKISRANADAPGWELQCPLQTVRVMLSPHHVHVLSDLAVVLATTADRMAGARPVAPAMAVPPPAATQNMASASASASASVVPEWSQAAVDESVLSEDRFGTLNSGMIVCRTRRRALIPSG